MPKRSSNQNDTQQLARSVLIAIVPDAEPLEEKPKKNQIRGDAEDHRTRRSADGVAVLSFDST